MMKHYGGDFGYGGMVVGGSLICSLIAIVVLIDLVLLGVWLWKKIDKDSKGGHNNN